MDFLFNIYGLAHLMLKRALGRPTLKVCRQKLFLKEQFDCSTKEAINLWSTFVDNSLIQEGCYRGFHYAGYILESKSFCLDSWIWTNAAIIRLLCAENRITQAKMLAYLLNSKQCDCGGWIVREDYDSKGAIPMLAPNDSAYIANNAFLSLYKATGELQYLIIARKCADWIIETSRDDGMVYTGFNIRDEVWDKNNIIVDVGFTGALFSRLYEITNEPKYLDFLSSFINRYINLFFNGTGFATSIDKNNHQQGGMFARGQAWALEGLIEAYKILPSANIKQTIEITIDTLLKRQHKDGSWSYNLTRPLMGNDCKGVPVIAKSLLSWYEMSGDMRVKQAAEMAFQWCVSHTLSSGEGRGGIYSYCVEGGIVKDLYSSCAFVYSSIYGIELSKILLNG